MRVTDALELVKARLTVDGKRAATVAEYVDEADRFATWFEIFEGRPAEVGDLSVANADRYVLTLMDRANENGRPWATATRQHHVVQLRAFCGHLAVVCGASRQSPRWAAGGQEYGPSNRRRAGRR